MSVPSITDCMQALEAGNVDQALALAIERLRHDKKDLDALSVCYQAYQRKNDDDNAAKVLAVVLGIDPDNDRAATELGAMSIGQGRLHEAEALLRRAVTVNPGNAAAHTLLGTVFSELNRLAAGEYHFRRALDISPRDVDSLTNLALNLTQQQKADEALDCYVAALDLEPGNVRTLAYLAKLHEVRGDLDAAEELLQRADAIRAGSVDLLLATLASRRGDHGRALEIINRAPALNGDALLERGHIRDRLADYDDAFADFTAAKAALAKEGGDLRYDAGAVEQFFTELRDAFHARAMAAAPCAKPRNDSPAPIFIVGAPRSGTTLVERILAAHPAVLAGGELPFIADLRILSEKLLPGDGFPQNIAAMRAGDQRHVATLFRDYYLAQREERLTVRPSDASANGEGVKFVTDKMPFNEVYLPLIRIAFPDCPIVHLRRHRLDTALSMLGNKLNHGFYCAYRIEDILHHVDAVSSLHEYYREQFDSHEFDLDYETLVREPEHTVRALCNYIGVSFDERCIDFHRNRDFVATPSYRQVNESINDRSVGRYKNYLRHLGEED